MNTQRKLLLGAFAMLMMSVALGLPACGGGGYKNPSAPSGGGTGGGTVGATVTLTANGASPTTVRISTGARVRFVNNDSRNHDIESTPHPTHTDCPPTNIGVLTPGESKETATYTLRGTCGFHDHLSSRDTTMQGQILVGVSEGEPNPLPPAY